eukprot:1158980-Pelagomonas_calceolata.AAC.2
MHAPVTTRTVLQPEFLSRRMLSGCHKRVRQDAQGGFKVDGLTEAPCKSAAAALRAISRALQYRHTRAHAMNEYSSRSHCLMTFNFASKGRLEEGGDKGVRREAGSELVAMDGGHGSTKGYGCEAEWLAARGAWIPAEEKGGGSVAGSWVKLCISALHLRSDNYPNPLVRDVDLTFAVSLQVLAADRREWLASTTATAVLSRYGKLVLVDLAGSERLKETGNSGAVAVRETGSINRSLFTLGQGMPCALQEACVMPCASQGACVVHQSSCSVAMNQAWIVDNTSACATFGCLGASIPEHAQLWGPERTCIPRAL